MIPTNLERLLALPRLGPVLGPREESARDALSSPHALDGYEIRGEDHCLDADADARDVNPPLLPVRRAVRVELERAADWHSMRLLVGQRRDDGDIGRQVEQDLAHVEEVLYHRLGAEGLDLEVHRHVLAVFPGEDGLGLGRRRVLDDLGAMARGRREGMTLRLGLLFRRVRNDQALVVNVGKHGRPAALAHHARRAVMARRHFVRPVVRPHDRTVVVVAETAGHGLFGCALADLLRGLLHAQHAVLLVVW